MAHRIGVIGGDGIGPEVVAEALKVARAAGADLDTADYDLGGARYLRTGEVLPDTVLDELRGLDAILLGAVGTPEVPPGVLERGLLLRLRSERHATTTSKPVGTYAVGCVKTADGRIPGIESPRRGPADSPRRGPADSSATVRSAPGRAPVATSRSCTRPMS